MLALEGGRGSVGGERRVVRPSVGEETRLRPVEEGRLVSRGVGIQHDESESVRRSHALLC